MVIVYPDADSIATVCADDEYSNFLPLVAALGLRGQMLQALDLSPVHDLVQVANAACDTTVWISKSLLSLRPSPLASAEPRLSPTFCP